MRAITGLIVACLLLLAGAAASADVPYPVHPANAGLVNDFAGVLSPSEKATLEKDLRAFEASTKAEVAVVTVTSLNGQTREDYAHGLFRAWGIGKKGADNGVLLLVAPNEKKVQIEVGTRLEPLLTDAEASEIVRGVIHDDWEAGNHDLAIIDGVHAIMAQLGPGLAVEGKDIMSHAKPKTSGGNLWIFIPIFFGVVLVLVLVFMPRRRKPEPEESKPRPQAAMNDDEPIYSPLHVERPHTQPAPQAPAMRVREPNDDSSSSFVTGAIVGAALAESEESPRRQERAYEAPPEPEPEDDSFSFGGGNDSGGGAGGDL